MVTDPFDDQAAANRLLQALKDVMSTLQQFKQTTGDTNDVLDDMMKVWYRHKTAIEVMDKQATIAQRALESRQDVFMKQQNKLQSNLLKKSRARSDEQDKQTREVNKRNAAYFAMQKEMVDYRHSFKDFDAGLNMLSNAMKSTPFAFAAGGVVGGVKGGAGIVQQTTRADDAQKKADAAKRAYDDFNQQNQKAMAKGGKKAKKLQDEMMDLLETRSKTEAAATKAKSGFLYKMGQQKTGGDKTLADRLKGIGDFLNKHKLGIFIALGSIIALGAIISKALDSSPMFAQMLKLWKFAIMMIFRPLGDFFGFFFRPILVLLLRKFIIPWYTTLYPAMIKLGNDLGQFVANIIGWFGGGTLDIADILAKLLGGAGNLGTQIVAFLVKGLIPSAFADTGMKILGDAWDMFFSGISTILNTMKPFVVTAIEWVGEVAQWLVGEGSKVVKFGWQTIKDQMPFITTVFTWLKDQLPNVKILFETFMTSLEWLKTKWTEVSRLLTTAYVYLNSAINMIASLPAKIWTALTSIPQQIANVFSNIMNSIVKELQKLPAIGWLFNGVPNSSSFSIAGMAEGGRITEPIMGVGRSGKQYAFGERGSETVIPDSKMGGYGGITINIQNMSGSQQDLNNLRQTILNVMQESRTRAGRI